MLPSDLFQFGYFPRWLDVLDELEEMAQSERWRFPGECLTRSNDINPLLERYINSIYSRAATLYNEAENQAQRDQLISIRHGFAIFHTNLFTLQYVPILAYFVRNTRPGERRWYFKGWATPGGPLLARAAPLPARVPFTASVGFDPSWPVRLNIEHITTDADNYARLPPDIRDSKILPLLLETAVELARRKAAMQPGIVQPQFYQQRIQFLLPISLTDPARHDLALTLQPADGYYIGSTMLTLRMAYMNARAIGRPTAAWLYEPMEGST